jgi:hypothetical protein
MNEKMQTYNFGIRDSKEMEEWHTLEFNFLMIGLISTPKKKTWMAQDV